jgi:glycosyltransferase involved in cell wall biosynthesis
MPLFSIITINLNNVNGLQKTIDSVLSQTCTDFEFIIIDGGSTDGSLVSVEKIAGKIKYFISEKDTGIYNAMNKGITQSTGKYLLFLNSGDKLVNSDIFQKVFNLDLQADIVYGDMQIQENNGLITHRKMPEKIGAMQLYADTIWHPVAFIKRDLFYKYGFYDEQFRIVSDYEFFVRMVLSKKVSTNLVPLEIALFDISGVSSAKENKVQLMKERAAVQDKYFNPLLLFLFRLYSKLRS